MKIHKILWAVISNVTCVIGLASISSDIVLWKEFISEIIIKYQSFVDPIFRFLFIWIPFGIPRFIHDYFVIAVIFSTSHVISIENEDPNHWGDPNKVPFFPYRLFNLTIGRALAILKNVILFPVIFFIVLPIGVLIHRSNPSDVELRRAGVEAISAYKRVGIIMLGLVTLLILNIVISR